MQRLLVILMLLIVPLQISWAAAAVYCQHEINPATVHFGHHEHKHVASLSDEKADVPKSSSASDIDCAFCHLGGIAIAEIPAAILISDVVNATSRMPDNSVLASILPPRPERPKWVHAAS
ncbi:cation efflux protein, CzcI family [Herminiimonas arsenitoxidans]|uniref:cation efflux protein, CzcI family n=1 Tax=Herminiimonas arsenitoxidans TaxID=1809410 RepID=UPI0009706FCB|nr:cation efflux protein, CzcI family [Herminiimonas arsenitoxidans]